MKKILVALTIASVFAACNSKPKETVVVVDTMAIKQKAIQDEQARIQAQKDEDNRIAAARSAQREEDRRAHRSSSESRSVGTSSSTAATGSGAATETPAKKGWSSAAKDAVIGGAAGAIAGGIIGHNIGGAAIGAAAGAGGGYLIGRAHDKKTGRVVKPAPQQ
jgi:hypothetical protein